jgi:nitrogen regulatory protein P-II 1
MKEIKAYIRTNSLERTVEALKEKGAKGITIVTVHPVGYGFDSRYSFKEVGITKRFHEITKIELVCDNENLDKYVNTIADCSHTGATGDGVIFVADIQEALRIKTLKKGTKLSELYD